MKPLHGGFINYTAADAKREMDTINTPSYDWFLDRIRTAARAGLPCVYFTQNDVRGAPGLTGALVAMGYSIHNGNGDNSFKVYWGG